MMEDEFNKHIKRQNVLLGILAVLLLGVLGAIVWVLNVLG